MTASDDTTEPDLRWTPVFQTFLEDYGQGKRGFSRSYGSGRGVRAHFWDLVVISRPKSKTGASDKTVGSPRQVTEGVMDVLYSGNPKHLQPGGKTGVL